MMNDDMDISYWDGGFGDYPYCYNGDNTYN